MNLSWDTGDVFAQYKSNSQRVRRLSEKWFLDEMFCPACSNDSLEAHCNNNPVADFYCPVCKEEYQLKSQSKYFSRRIVDGAYSKMIESIRNEEQPNFFFLHYDQNKWNVTNLLVIPRYYFTESIIERRNPLSKTARRAGWTGCNILLSNIPADGRIPVVEKHEPIHETTVRDQWNKTNFLKNNKPEKRTWIVDVMRCVNQLKQDKFTLADIYNYENTLKKQHPENNNIKPKIRQQLQYLRDNGYLTFKGKGEYELK